MTAAERDRRARVAASTMAGLYGVAGGYAWAEAHKRALMARDNDRRAVWARAAELCRAAELGAAWAKTAARDVVHARDCETYAAELLELDQVEEAARERGAAAYHWVCAVQAIARWVRARGAA